MDKEAVRNALSLLEGTLSQATDFTLLIPERHFREMPTTRQSEFPETASGQSRTRSRLSGSNPGPIIVRVADDPPGASPTTPDKRKLNV